MSLVACYSDSDSDRASDQEDDEKTTTTTTSKKCDSSAAGANQNINFLTAEFSESESEGNFCDV